MCATRYTAGRPGFNHRPMPSSLDRAALRLHDPEADPLDWAIASDDEILAALNRSDMPFPNLDFLQWVEQNRPELWQTARAIRQILRDAGHSIDSIEGGSRV